MLSFSYWHKLLMFHRLTQFHGVIIASTKKGPDISCWEGTTLCLYVCLCLCVCLYTHSGWSKICYFLDLTGSKFGDSCTYLLEAWNVLMDGLFLLLNIVPENYMQVLFHLYIVCFVKLLAIATVSFFDINIWNIFGLAYKLTSKNFRFFLADSSEIIRSSNIICC